MNKKLLLACGVLGACMGGVNTAPVPEMATGDVQVRGSEARQLSVADESEIVANVVRGFYRTYGGQVRLIDPRPLADERDPQADAVKLADQDRAAGLARVIGLQRVCVQDMIIAPECADRTGGILRFSPAYSTGRDSAVIYVEYRSIGGSGVPGEIEFRMVRRAQQWQMASRRSLSPARVHPSRAVAERLLQADRAYGSSAGNTDLVSALSAMFDDSVIVQIPGGFADGKAVALAALRANADNERSRTTWAPIRAGVSADGLHGFTYGYMTHVRPDSVRVPLKYLAYWVNRGGTWKVLAYKRRPRPAGEVSTAVLAPSLPADRLSPVTNPGIVAAHGLSLAAAEKEFSDAAQVIGIGPAFEKYGRPDAMNIGGPTDTAFVIGNSAIGRSVGAAFSPGGSPVSWAADYRHIVASTGDLGVTFGYIRPNETPKAGQPQFVPFFTIWKREPGGPWRYIAE